MKGEELLGQALYYQLYNKMNTFENQKEVNIKNDFRTKQPSKIILREEITEKDKITKWIYNIIILLGGLGFLCVGISSYLKYNIITFLNSSQIIFYPQGITMSFYGSCAIVVSINQFRILLNNIGEGYNEFNKDKGIMQIYRKGFKGKDSDVNIICSLTDIVRVKMHTIIT